ncbi:MAG: ATP-binding protein [Phycisphaerae bacterium]
MLQFSRELIAADAYAVWQRDEITDIWKVASSSNLSEEFVRSQLPGGQGNELLGGPIIVHDVQQDSALAFRRSVYQREGIRSMMVFPLRARTNYLGTLVLYYRTLRHFEPGEISIGEALSSLASAAIDNALSHRRQMQLRAEAEASERRHRFLADASIALASSLDYEATLTTVAKLAIPDLADWCTVDLADEDGSIRRVAVAHSDPEKVKWAWEIGKRYPPNPASDRGVPGVIKRGAAELHANITDEMLVGAAVDEEHLRILREVGLNDVIMAPLKAQDRTYGVITFIAANSMKRYTSSDLLLLEDLAARAGLAIDNARLYQEAKQANQAKDRFVAVLSHELRTPLTPVLGLISTMQKDASLPESVQADLRVLRRNVELEARLIDDMLDLTRIAKGKLQLQLQAVDAHAALRDVYELFSGEALEKKLNCTLRLEAREHMVEADPARLRQMFWNLLKNAIKFTPSGGAITIESRNVTSDDKRLLVIAISDTGIGIEEKFLPTVFDAFEQSERGRMLGGLGLGLAITKNLTELHGGSILVESAGAGKGATFVMSLPTLAVPEKTNGDREAGLKSGEATRSLRILLLEDHPDSAAVMLRILKLLGHMPVLTTTVKDAVRLTGEQSFDLVISDVGLPDGSGMDFLKDAKFAKPTPAIAVSGFGMDDDVRRSMVAGFAAHLTKPVNIEALSRAIEEVAG